MKKAHMNATFLPFLTGLRAYAALMVFIIHAGQFIPQTLPFISNVVAYGSQGVPIFFFLSAFTLSLSISDKKQFSYLSYLLQRVRRIFPLYYFFMILGFSFEWARRGGEYFREMYDVAPLSIQNIFYHISFLNFFHQKYLLTLTGIDSMIPFEFFFYLWIPVFYFFARRSPIFLLPLILLGMVFYFNPSFHLPIYYFIYASGDLTFERHLLTYTLGVLAFVLLIKPSKIFRSSFEKMSIILFSIMLGLYLWQNLQRMEELFLIGLVLIFLYSYKLKPILVKKYKKTISQFILANGDLLLLLFVFLCYMNVPHYHEHKNLFTTLFTGVLIACCLKGGLIKSLIFENKLILHIGKISFSFYLVHLIIITTIGTYLENGNILHFLLLMVLTAGISTISHRFIEAPFYKSHVHTNREKQLKKKYSTVPKGS